MKKMIALLLVAIVIVAGVIYWTEHNPTISPDLENQYQELKKDHALKYENVSDAIAAFKTATDPHMEVTSISNYVGGKLPREDGDPYLIGRGVINESENQCIKGYMNLVTGISESHRDVCIIYN